MAGWSHFPVAAQYLGPRAWPGWVLPAIPAGVALAVRLGYVLVAGSSGLAWGDEFVYDQLAQNILRHSCFCFVAGEESVLRPPLYPAVLALTYAVFGHSYAAALVLQAIAGAASVYLFAIIGEQVSGSPRVGMLTGWLSAVNPLLVYTTSLLYSESLYLLLLALITYGLLRLASYRRNWPVVAITTGLVWGLSLLMKPNLFPLIFALPLWGWLVLGELRRAIAVAVCVGVAVVLAVLPWSVRNLGVTGQFVLVSANAGLNMWQGNNPEADGSGLPLGRVDPLRGLSEVERDNRYMQWALDWIRADPKGFISLVPLKVLKTLSPLETATRGSMAVSFAPLILTGSGLYYGLTAWGMIATRPRWRKWLLIHAFIAYPILVAAVFHGGTRYGLIAQPFMGIFAASAVLSLIPRRPFGRMMPRGTTSDPYRCPTQRGGRG